jgi:poly-gamma-glutamate capsule biosynthesis protein CapA/YwtB (metallophosphatase superfamily)
MARILKLKFSRFVLAATCLAIASIIGVAVWPQSPLLTITLVGQSMIRSDIRVTAPSAMPVIASLLKGDVKFTNFEATVIEPGQPNETTPELESAGGDFLTPPGALGALQALGFNLLSLANNHEWDLKVPGVQNTIREADKLSLVHAGTGNTVNEAVAPSYLRTPKGTIGFVAMASPLGPGAAATATRPGANELRVDQVKNGNGSVSTPGSLRNQEDAERILHSIRDASKKADLVIVSQHNHIFDISMATMFLGLPERFVQPAWMKKWTHEEVDAGANIVVMHGAPILQGVEIYHNGVIFYDMGNFIFNFPATGILDGGLDDPLVWESAVAYLEYQGKNLKSITFRPIVMNKIGEGQPDVHNIHTNNLFLDTHGLPKPATGDQAHYILQRLADLSRPFGTTVEVKGDTAEIDLQGRH